MVMLFAAEFGTGQVFWSILWFFLFFLWISLIISVFADIIRAHDMSGWAKAAWTIVIIVVPVFGALMYLIVNGNDMGQRTNEQVRAQDEATQAYIRNAAGSGAGAELSRLAELHTNGSLTDEEYASAKASVLDG
jgi:hypothetical protein